MALITGKDCDIKIGTKSYKSVVNSFALEFDTTEVNYDTLAGPLAGAGSETGTLTLTFAYDSGETSSLFDDLWTATDSSTKVAYDATVGQSRFTGNAVAARPNATGTAGEASEVSVTLSLDGIPTKAAVTGP